LVAASRPLDAEDWARLRHPEEDQALDSLFAIFSRRVTQAVARPHKQLGLHKREALSDGDERACAQALRYVARTMGIPAPEAYVRYDQKQPVVFRNCALGKALAPALLLGLPLLGDRRSDRELSFRLAQTLAYLRPERIVGLVLKTAAEIASLIDTAKAISCSKAAEGEGAAPALLPEQVRALQSLSQSFSKAVLDQVAALGGRLRAQGIHSEVAASRWLAACDATANRAAFVLCGDLAGCVALIRSETPGAALSQEPRVLDLIWSSTTDELTSVRERCGLAHIA
jgi:hypothetical protein